MVARKRKARPKKTRGELRTEATRQALLSAASELFAEKGMDLTTIDDITVRADVAKGTFYYHFKNKNRLIKELMRNMLKDKSTAYTRSLPPQASWAILMGIRPDPVPTSSTIPVEPPNILSADRAKQRSIISPCGPETMAS